MSGSDKVLMLNQCRTHKMSQLQCSTQQVSHGRRNDRGGGRGGGGGYGGRGGGGFRLDKEVFVQNLSKRCWTIKSMCPA